MAQERDIRIWGKQREDIDVDLMAQIVIMLGRQIAHQAIADEQAEGGEFESLTQKTTDLSGDELGQENGS